MELRKCFGSHTKIMGLCHREDSNVTSIKQWIIVKLKKNSNSQLLSGIIGGSIWNGFLVYIMIFFNQCDFYISQQDFNIYILNEINTDVNNKIILKVINNYLGIIMRSAIIPPRFACWIDLILSEFQNQFCDCSAHPGQERESGLLFSPKIPALLRIGY